MKYFNTYVFISTLASSSLLVFTPLTYATDLSGNFDVTITIASMCTMNTSSIGVVAFGSQPSAATNIQATGGSIDVTCTLGTSYTLGLNSGGNDDGSTRRMIGQTVDTDFVAYVLYSDPTNLSAWGDGTTFGAVKDGTGLGTLQSHIIYGKVPSANASAQNYKDTVTATVTW
jgi:spore coat protein U-like protein